ncbi:hypothetical protein SERLA73DRAFT_170295 [Serpula lacrymans var. lacrymans S7.3]|uniref:RRM domain-containing protein n=2 Tax=Serpula lacrymans var. lacrymans TaxID=341189 RepID=F8Q494_SERL3|nr:uncharacterized protein SERLADRAFT_473514 [Serpula lacrymans var. lacrymans S7.9]EGN96949.1 hypothetical protein SERLA73DRAFT_170295 [Serpula lacrymans var. lacrymans S7.3]EGO22541.1 hypothetical protein SERLADRAFT_473514 [Serpula lacrymans var. lacrymans S7.9]
MEPVTKRLHVSGLTPAITQDDISRRLSGFGTVKSLDGFGKVDGVGMPRKFGYVTLESTKGQLAKCLNVLSGSTWKGTKLRIGEAKPDYHERLEAERSESSGPPKKKRKSAQGVHAPDMSLVTPENASERGGWRVTQMGRIVRPARMRPERPLAPQMSTPSVSKKGGLKKKPRIKAALVRSRRRTIDPTKWDSVHLKGMFLDAEGVISQKKEIKEDVDNTGKHANDTSSDDDTDSEMSSVHEEQESSTNDAYAVLKNPHTEPPTSLNVSMDVDIKVLRSQKEPFVALVEEPLIDTHVSPGPERPTRVTKLKDLFAPREEEAGFSLLGHLDIDLELDDEFAVPVYSQSQLASVVEAAPRTAVVDLPVPASDSGQFKFDPNQPFFFPLSSDLRDNLRPKDKGRVKDLLDVAKDKGWNWRDAGFYRTQTEDEIRKRWEKNKAELTRDWKKRHREAGKMRRRRGGVDGE